MLNRDDYIATAEALHACVEARVPVILWGPPGQGKTSVIRALAELQGRHIEILLASIREPQDFAGLPSIHVGAMSLIPPNWAARLRDDGNGILFTDEVNTAPPAVQAALLRVCLDKVAGDCELGERTSIIAAANPPEQAADGWDLAPPLANRFCHLDKGLGCCGNRNGHRHFQCYCHRHNHHHHFLPDRKRVQVLRKVCLPLELNSERFSWIAIRSDRGTCFVDQHLDH